MCFILIKIQNTNTLQVAVIYGFNFIFYKKSGRFVIEKIIFDAVQQKRY